eukprot:880864-Pelagomonas_calceolata.AAC.1
MGGAGVGGARARVPSVSGLAASSAGAGDPEGAGMGGARARVPSVLGLAAGGAGAGGLSAIAAAPTGLTSVPAGAGLP